MNARIERIENILKEYKYKITEGRKEIIKIFLEYDNKHLKINDIYDLAKNKISLPTIYRTVEIFKHIGIIDEVIIDEERYYELKIFSKKCLHIHFRCENCNTIYDYYDSKIAIKLLDEKEKIEQKYDIIVYDMVFVLDGLCDKCRR